MSAALVILPMVWATSSVSAEPEENFSELVEQGRTAPEVAFYRKYTEALLRRYVRLDRKSVV